MKSVLETSLMLVMFVILVMTGLDFILMNVQVNRIYGLSEQIEYLADGVESVRVYPDDESGAYINRMDERAEDYICTLAAKDNVEFTYEYVSETRYYVLYEYKLKYKMQAHFLNISTDAAYKGYIELEKRSGL